MRPDDASLAEELSLAMTNILDEMGLSPTDGGGEAIGWESEEVRDIFDRLLKPGIPESDAKHKNKTLHRATKCRVRIG